MHTHKLEMYTIYDISLHNINIVAIIPFEKLDALLKDLDKFNLVIYTEIDKGFSVLNLNLLLKD